MLSACINAAISSSVLALGSGRTLFDDGDSAIQNGVVGKFFVAEELLDVGLEWLAENNVVGLHRRSASSVTEGAAMVVDLFAV